MPLGEGEMENGGQVLFFFPFRPPSGVSNLFRRMAEHLVDRYHLKVAIVDYPDGQMAKNLQPGSGVELFPFQDGQRFVVPAGAILVMQTMLPYAVRPELEVGSDTRLLFWHFLYYNLVNVLFPLGPLRTYQMKNPSLYRKFMNVLRPGLLRSLRQYVEDLACKRAILFQDGFTLDQTAAFLGCKPEDPIYLPVPVEVRPFQEASPPPDAGCLRLGWVGRLYDFKIHILLHTLERLSLMAAQRSQSMVFTVVGDGDFIDTLRDGRFNHAHFQVRLAGVIESSELVAFMRQNMDVVASMGTSALEAAMAGLPTILLDYSLGPVQGHYKFKWLFEAVNGDIGHDLLPTDFEAEPVSLEGMIEALAESRVPLARKCYDYCLKTHGLDAIGASFYVALGASTFRFRDTPVEIVRKGLVRRIKEYNKYGIWN